VIGVLTVLSVGCLTMWGASDAMQTDALDRPVPDLLFALRVTDVGAVSELDQQDELLAFCQEFGFNRLIVAVSLAKESRRGAGPTLAHADTLRRLIAKAAGRGIRIEALYGGGPLGSQEGHATEMAVLDAVLAFNQNKPTQAKLAGIQYDVEAFEPKPWGTPRRDSDMWQCLKLFEKLRARIDQEDPLLRLSATMSYADKSRRTAESDYSVEYQGERKDFHEHLQDQTDSIVVMCPRQLSDDDVPMSVRLEPELGYGQWVGRSVWVGMRALANAASPGATYYGRPTWEFWLHKRDTETALSDRQEFGGVVVDDYQSFRRLVLARPEMDAKRSVVTQSSVGLWVWDSQSIKTHDEQDRLLAFCERYGIDRLSVQVHIEPGSAKRGQPKLMFADPLRRLIVEAKSKGIRVEALDGAPEMAMPENRSTVLAILDEVMAFNQTLPPDTGFVSMHYDIEPYLLPQWDTPQRQAIMHQYLDLLETAQMKMRLDAPGMALVASIPFWYDNRVSPGDSCILEFNGQRKNFHEHIQDLTDYVAVMSYRRHAVGDDSITQHLEVERAYAEWIGKTVCVGIETMEIKKRPEVSFYGLPRTEFWFQKQKIEQVLGKRGGFGGVMIHSYGSFREYLSTGDRVSE